MKKYLHSITILLAGVCGGCSLDIPYDNQFSDPDAISTPEAARELLASAYAAIPNMEFDLALMTDDFTPTYWASSNPTLLNQYNWQPQAVQDLSSTTWSGYYGVIATLNALIERIPGIPAGTETSRIHSEAMALKAYCYFQLLRLYGPDFATDPDAEAIVLKDALAMANLRRSSARETAAEIKRLLTAALSGIGTAETGTDWIGPDATRLLLAQAQLYSGEYAEAADNALAVLTSRGYGAFDQQAYRYLWDGSACEERIFAYNSPVNTQSFYIGIVYDATGGDYFAVNPALAASYADDDCRRDASIYHAVSPTIGEQDYLGKYNALRKEQHEIGLINKLRLSDALFTYAEASCLKGTAAGEADASAAVNEYLERRGAPKLADGLTGDGLLKAILEEKRREFVGEGTRYFDLKRYGSILDGARVAADDYRWRWPIPRDEYLYNSNITQNPEWPMISFD